jgi:hypothetical protein
VAPLNALLKTVGDLTDENGGASGVRLHNSARQRTGKSLARPPNGTRRREAWVGRAAEQPGSAARHRARKPILLMAHLDVFDQHRLCLLPPHEHSPDSGPSPPPTAIGAIAIHGPDWPTLFKGRIVVNNRTPGSRSTSKAEPARTVVSVHRKSRQTLRSCRISQARCFPVRSGRPRRDRHRRDI